MKEIKRIERNWKWFEILLALGIAFWLLETFVFLLIYGWHLKPIGVIEMICDLVSSIIIRISVILFFVCVYDVIKLIFGSITEEDD